MNRPVVVPTWFLIAIVAGYVLNVILDHTRQRHVGEHFHFFTRDPHAMPGERRFHFFWWHPNHGGGR